MFIAARILPARGNFPIRRSTTRRVREAVNGGFLPYVEEVYLAWPD
jgi:hypothetical protein